MSVGAVEPDQTTHESCTQFQVPVSDGLTSMQHVPRELQKGCLDPLDVQVLPVS